MEGSGTEKPGRGRPRQIGRRCFWKPPELTCAALLRQLRLAGYKVWDLSVNRPYIVMLGLPTTQARDLLMHRSLRAAWPSSMHNRPSGLFWVHPGCLLSLLSCVCVGGGHDLVPPLHLHTVRNLFLIPVCLVVLKTQDTVS